MAKAHKNADFVLGDDCREPSSAHWSSALPATSPAGCIWQQCARQQIAATYHATCRRACCRNLPPRPTCRSYYRACRRGATAEELPQKATAVCFRRHTCRHATCRQDLPAGHTTVHTPANPPPRNLPPCILPQPARRAYYRAMGPAPSGRVIRM